MPLLPLNVEKGARNQTREHFGLITALTNCHAARRRVIANDDDDNGDDIAAAAAIAIAEP